MSNLVTALLVRNEADKDLARVLDDAGRYSDQILVLDDCSTDRSRVVAKKHGAIVRTRRQGGMWGNEAPARKELWDWGAMVAGDGWLLICDADQLLLGDPRPYCTSDIVNTWCFVLYDLWGEETRYRCDGYWQAHTLPRPWLFCPSRHPDGWMPQWPARGIHTGHCPVNWPVVAGVAPDLAWLHRAYLTPERRRVKLQQYLRQSDTLTPFELAHAHSIGDT